MRAEKKKNDVIGGFDLILFGLFDTAFFDTGPAGGAREAPELVGYQADR